MITSNTASVVEARIFAQAMEGRNVDLTVSISEIGIKKKPKTQTEVILEQGENGRKFILEASATPECYAKDSSKIMPISRHGFTLVTAAVGEDGVRLILEDRKTGSQRAFRILLSKRDDCERSITYKIQHPAQKLKAA